MVSLMYTKRSTRRTPDAGCDSNLTLRRFSTLSQTTPLFVDSTEPNSILPSVTRYIKHKNYSGAPL